MSSESSVTVSWSDIEAKLLEFTKLRHKAWLSNVDEVMVVGAAAQAVLNKDPRQGPVAFVVHGIFCMFQIGRPWWAGQEVLQEEIMFAVHPCHDFKLFLEYLECMAQQHGCHGVVVGTSLSDRDEALCRALRSHGYSPVATELYKEIGAWDS